jgi:aryl-alcohol dehydrogenase-like predicted oxidoreductase
MKYKKLGTSDLEISVIGQGTWPMGNDFFGQVDEDEAIQAIHASIDNGVNFIDTAPGYGANGEAESVVGKAIRDRRDKVVLATKCGILRIWGEYVKCLSPSTIRHEVEDSLRRLHTDWIDLYQIHWPDYNFGIEGALDTLADLKKEGKIREIGVSNFSLEELQCALKRTYFASIQTPFSLLDRSGVDNGIIPFGIRSNIGIVSYGTLGGGILTGMTKKPVTGGREQRANFYNFYSEPLWSKCRELVSVLKEIAYAKGVSVAGISIGWAIAQPGIACSLAGSVLPKQAAENAMAGDVVLSGEELAVIDNAYSRIMD